MSRQDLEPIEEQVKEENAVPLQNGGFTISQSLSKQALEIEESYSFSLRNYPGHRTGGANINSNGRNSVTSKQEHATINYS
jgi:hypothetical protein